MAGWSLLLLLPLAMLADAGLTLLWRDAPRANAGGRRTCSMRSSAGAGSAAPVQGCAGYAPGRLRRLRSCLRRWDDTCASRWGGAGGVAGVGRGVASAAPALREEQYRRISGHDDLAERFGYGLPRLAVMVHDPPWSGSAGACTTCVTPLQPTPLPLEPFSQHRADRDGGAGSDLRRVGLYRGLWLRQRPRPAQ